MTKRKPPHEWKKPQDPLARFMLKVRKTSHCWEWTAARNEHGYGVFSPGAAFKGRLAHRFSYTWFVGPIPPGFELDHLCRNPPCVRPSHLEVVTHQENMRRGYWAKKRQCCNGHPYDEENTVWGKRGRRCRECHRAEAMARKRRAGAIPYDPHNCPKGHPRTPTNTYLRPDGKGRMCIPCQKARQARYSAPQSPTEPRRAPEPPSTQEDP